MTIPKYESIMLPLLKFEGDNQEHSMREAIEHIADTFNLSVTTLKKSIPITSRNGVQAKQGGALFFIKSDLTSHHKRLLQTAMRSTTAARRDHEQE